MKQENKWPREVIVYIILIPFILIRLLIKLIKKKEVDKID